MLQSPQHGDSDILETMSGANPNQSTHRAESASSEADAGLDDAGLDELNGAFDGESESADLDENLPNDVIREISMTDLDDTAEEDAIHSPELADMNVPGEIDIEGLDEDALEGAGLPPDALLDHLEP